MPEISERSGNKIGFEVELVGIKVSSKNGSNAMKNGYKLLEIKDENGEPFFWLETEGAYVSQSVAVVESYVEAISRPLRTSEEILRFFRLIQPLVGEKYDNNVDAKTSLERLYTEERLYAGERLQLGEDDAVYCLKGGSSNKTIQVNISMCLSAVHCSKKLLDIMPPYAKKILEEARKHTDEICKKEKRINGENSIGIRNYVKSFLTLVFYQFKIYRMKGIEDYYYKIDSAGKYIGEKGKLGSKECTVKQEFPVLFKVGLVDILTKVFNQNDRKVLQKLMSISDNSKERNLILEELNKIILGSSWKMVCII